MESLKNKIVYLSLNRKSIYKYSLPEVMCKKLQLLLDLKNIYLLGDENLDEQNTDEKIEVYQLDLVTNDNRYNKQRYPIIEYKHEGLHDLAFLISHKLSQTLNRTITITQNPNCDRDLVLKLYGVYNLSDLQTSNIKWCQDLPILYDMLTNPQEPQEGTGGTEGQNHSAHHAHNKPNNQSEVLAQLAHNEPKEATNNEGPNPSEETEVLAPSAPSEPTHTNQ